MGGGIDAKRGAPRAGGSTSSVEGEGYSIWFTPKLVNNFEMLFRHDSIENDTSLSQDKTRDIVGVAYWIPHLQRVQSAIMLDGERVEYDDTRPDETRYAVHVLINF